MSPPTIFPSDPTVPAVHLDMANASIEIVTVHTANRGAFAVAVYPTSKLGWAANYGALETYNNTSREAAIASLRLSLEISNPAPRPSDAEAFGSTLRCAERGARC